MIEDVLDITQSINVKANPRWRTFLLSNRNKRASLRKPGWGTGLMRRLGSAQWWSVTKEQKVPSRQHHPLVLWRQVSWHHTENGKTPELTLYWVGQNVCLDLSVISHGKTQTKILAKPVFFSVPSQWGLWVALGKKKKSNDFPYNLWFEDFMCPMDHLDKEVFTGWPDVHLFPMGCA